MTLTVRQLAGIVRYESGSKPGTPIELRELVNMAGRWLVHAYPWKWLTGRAYRLSQRAQVSITAGTWTEATLTLTEVGAFADYTFVTGDTFELSSGTGATVALYEVESRVDDDSITLTLSIGSAADGEIDIVGRLQNDQVELPAGIQSIVAIQTRNGTVQSFDWTDPMGMLNLRSWPGLRDTVSFYGFVNWVRLNTGGTILPRMELWSEALENLEVFSIFYRGGWIEPIEDTSELSLPSDGRVDLLFIEALKAIVNGFEDPEQGSVDQRLGALKGGILFYEQMQLDASMQPDLGPMENTWMTGSPMRIGRYDVSPPPIPC